MNFEEYICTFLSLLFKFTNTLPTYTHTHTYTHMRTCMRVSCMHIYLVYIYRYICTHTRWYLICALAYLLFRRKKIEAAKFYREARNVVAIFSIYTEIWRSIFFLNRILYNFLYNILSLIIQHDSNEPKKCQ